MGSNVSFEQLLLALVRQGWKLGEMLENITVIKLTECDSIGKGGREWSDSE